MSIKKLFKIGLSLSLLGLPKLSLAQDIDDYVLRLGQTYFFSDAIETTLYDRNQNYREAFNCDSVLLEQKNDQGGINAMCVNGSNIISLQTQMGPKGRLSSVYACPSVLDDEVVNKIKSAAFDTVKNSNGTLYFLGYRRNWLRKYVNRMFIFDEHPALVCWDIGRR